MLENKYFYINSCEATDNGHSFSIRLDANHPVYNGHFPGNPVSPGVCSIEMIKECVERLVKSDSILVSINQCRFINVLTPDKGDNLFIKVSSSLEDSIVKVSSTIVDANDIVYVTFKGEFQLK